MFRRKAFTLVELLTVLAIIAILAAILFPVFRSVKESAKKTNCFSNFKQVHAATVLYLADYDDTFMPLNHNPSGNPTKVDRTWVQILLPYVRSMNVFLCPSDYSPKTSIDIGFDEDLIPPDTYARYYEASKHVNVGYNYLNLAPIVKVNGVWTSVPRIASNVQNPSETLVFADSVWTRTSSGAPSGGGSYIVIPPCRYKGQGPHPTDLFGGGTVYSPYMGWNVHNEKAPNYYGNAWPWHTNRVNLIRWDGSAKSFMPTQLYDGCNLEDAWQGRVTSDGYIWDTQ